MRGRGTPTAPHVTPEQHKQELDGTTPTYVASKNLGVNKGPEPPPPEARFPKKPKAPGARAESGGHRRGALRLLSAASLPDLGLARPSVWVGADLSHPAPVTVFQPRRPGTVTEELLSPPGFLSVLREGAEPGGRGDLGPPPRGGEVSVTHSVSTGTACRFAYDASPEHTDE